MSLALRLICNFEKIFFLFCLAVFILTAFLLKDQTLLNVDEAFFAAVATYLNDTGLLPLEGSRDSKPPGIFFIYQLIFMISTPYDMSAVRIFSYLWLFLVAFVTYFSSRAFLSREVSWFATGLFLINVLTTNSLAAFKTEHGLLLPFAISVLFFLNFLKSGRLIFLFLQ